MVRVAETKSDYRARPATAMIQSVAAVVIRGKPWCGGIRCGVVGGGWMAANLDAERPTKRQSETQRKDAAANSGFEEI